MTDQPIKVRVGQSTLLCVPAVHFRLAFAQRINQLSRKWRPDAIAVELGPETAAAGAAWLRELGVGPVGSPVLPCMLGLMKFNRRIRASRRELALRLQEENGKDLRELPPELLKKRLGFSGVRILYLSPTDSIIDAMRCALELKTPLYGIDLEECAEREPLETRIQDPTGAFGSVEAYVSGNERFADSHRDEEIDGRRELAMAARLKTLLQRHRLVLFTCGLAHWLQIKRLLQNPDVKPAPATETAALRPEGFRRIVVHPLLAVHHMDLFPAFAKRYQQSRRPSNESVEIERHITPADMFTQLLKKSYVMHFVPKICAAFEPGTEEDSESVLAGSEEEVIPSAPVPGVHQDWESRPFLEQFLLNLCKVRQLNVPDLHTALAAAQATMSPKYCKTLAEALMEFEWATPQSHPGLSVLAPAPTDAGDLIRAELIDANGERGKEYFYIDTLPGCGGNSYRVRVPIPWEWCEIGPPPPEDGELRTYQAADHLKTALSARAIDISTKERNRFSVNAFEGSLLEGLDLKATMRGYIRGEDRIYVRDVQRIKTKKACGDGFPVVWIFQSEAIPGSLWHPTAEWIDNFTKHADAPVCDRESHDRFKAESGADCMVVAVDYSLESSKNGYTCYQLSGILLFTPPHFSSAPQYGKWANATEYRRNPFLNDFNFARLRTFYMESKPPIRCPFDPAAFDWATALILMAIPFAAGRLTVVAPDAFRLPSVVSQHAARYGAVINYAPMSYFPRDVVQIMATDYIVPSLPEGDGNEYSEEVQRRMGVEQTAYERLVPRMWLDYGKSNSK